MNADEILPGPPDWLAACLERVFGVNWGIAACLFLILALSGEVTAGTEGLVMGGIVILAICLCTPLIFLFVGGPVHLVLGALKLRRAAVYGVIGALLGLGFSVGLESLRQEFYGGGFGKIYPDRAMLPVAGALALWAAAHALFGWYAWSTRTPDS
ncbi:hypothetical protein [Maricaulis sp.]|uniref:hypothetical protein n=1 Tax=Maricaulis sp. TaxID=1486257 RepID=UPI003A8CE91D